MANETKDRTVYKTTNYGMFRRLNGNREVQEARVRKIMRSIDRVGYIPEPVIINENNEVIDGQGRIEAAKRKELPVYYIKIPGLRYEHCVESNNTRTGWRVKDYIGGFADQGDTNYQYLSQLVKQYGGKISDLALFAAASPSTITGASSETIKGGTYRCTQEQYEEACRIADYIVSLGDAMKQIEGRRDRVAAAVKFLYQHPEVDNDILKEKLEKHARDVAPIASIRQAVQELERIYNYRSRNKAFVLSDYDKAVAQHGGGVR